MHFSFLARAMRPFIAVFLLGIILVGVYITRPSTQFKVISAGVKLLGPEEIVFDWSRDACDPQDIPDAPTRAFRDKQGRVQLLASHYTNRRMIGPDLDHLTRDCTVILTSDYDRDPAKYDDREWIHSVYTLDGSTVYALIHDEYQGHRYRDRCASGDYTRCWYNSITLAVSTDGGATYRHAEPPSHLVASIPYPQTPDTGPAGIFSPSNIVRNPADGYYYALIRVERYEAQLDGSCVMRTANLADPSSWRAWDGRGFNVRFSNPYSSPPTSPEGHLCQPVSRNAIQKMSESLTFNTYFDRFMLVGAAGRTDARTGKPVWGIYYSLSDDLINWTPRRLILEAEMPWTHECGDPNPIMYPVVLDPQSSSRNFETAGQSVYLYFTRPNYIFCRMTLDRDLVRIPVEFTEKELANVRVPRVALPSIAVEITDKGWASVSE